MHIQKNAIILLMLVGVTEHEKMHSETWKNT